MANTFQEQLLDLPRITGTLRAFSNLSRHYTSLDPAQEKDLIYRRLVQQAQEKPEQLSAAVPIFGDNIKFYSFYQRKLLAGDEIDQDLVISSSSSSDDDQEYFNSDEETDGLDDDNEDSSQSIRFNFPTDSVREAAEPNYLDWTQGVSSDIVTVVYEILSKQSDAEIQNELVELLGFEKLELVEFLCTNKHKVIQAHNNSKNSSSKSSRSVANPTSQAAAITSTDITVHTASEKRIKKQIVKEQKRLNKLGGGATTTASSSNEFADSFDPTALRKLREEQLAEARLLQLYHQQRLESLQPDMVQKSKADQYPFVFDNLQKIAQTSAFIAGSKILLPETMRRTDNRTHEEVYIPPSDSIAKLDPESLKGTKEEICTRPLVRCDTLDHVGKIAFRNVKTLNRIQSTVFDTAYNTNQNLLICAPTGAGKTNIAMLTIVNEIKKHIDGSGVLHKDEFKIVYIAPMKALASEMVENFSKRLDQLGIVVRELTGDMQLTKQEILQTQMLVTTPEKWDVVTRKSTGDVSLSLLVKLLIIDEVHLLHDDRGSVIETIVARTLRQVESSQKMIRIVGLSATLPNYLDVARFLNVDPKRGLFFFDSRFRPVPLAQTFIGVKSTNKSIQMQQMDEVCYDKVVKMVREGHQVMVFVHARNATLKTAQKLREMAKNQGEIELFRPESCKELGDAQRQMSKSRNKQLKEIFDDGFSVHHAGLLRSDRNMVEKFFLQGHIRLLVCTATLAWGVNLPAHAVVIKGTELYDAKKGSFVDISMLDILQIFGRAGRPQFDTNGEAYIITTHNKLAHYLSLLTRQAPIESQFVNSLADNLNAEVCLGSVTSVQEGAKWLSYTYLHVRMRFNPLAYGLTYKTFETDPNLQQHREDLIRIAARSLDKAHMIRFDEITGSLNPTDLGRTASHYYIKYDTIETFNLKLKDVMNDKEIISIMSQCSEFQQLKVRDEELEEMDKLNDACVLPVIGGGVENSFGKVNCLIQAYISRARVEGFSLISDQAYVSQNIGRIARALFEITLKKGWALMSGRLLNVCKSIEKQIWHFQNPMRQFESFLNFEVLSKIEDKNISVEKLRDMDSKEIGILLRHPKMGDKVKECLSYLPSLEIESSLHPITRTVLRVRIHITPRFRWNDKLHGTVEQFWVWIEDPSYNHIYHHELFNLQKKFVKAKESQELIFTIPIFEPLPSQYIVRVISDRWLGVEFTHSLSFKHLILPEQHPPHTELLDLDPLPKTALQNPSYESLYSFSHFNPIQTQIFHCFYHTDNNCLLGAPTGSGKTITAELAIFRVFNQSNKKKVVYIAPLKALVRERIIDWKVRLEEKLGKKVVELTGDVAPDMKIVAESDVIVTTPEKWDGISRSWQTRNYVKDVALIIIDEIHLLGEDRGPVLEVIVSRTNFISSHTNRPVRIIGLSTALANARDLANWLNIKEMGLFNFKPSVRPVPLEVHIQGYAGKFYCPRMATMNKPCFQEISMHSPNKPALIFVSSRRQTRLTALELISFLANDAQPKKWLHMPETEMNSLLSQVTDQNLKLTLAFGIGLHHAGLNEKDRKLVEELFCNQKTQVLVATSTLAWGVNFPAHLVIVKGTEYYDGKTKRYVDFPITDVLQMMGRAGRPQFDDSGIAVIMVQDVKKHFYKKFLYEPFPVESCLLGVLPDHLNAEIVASTITNKQEACDYLTWTFFFRRLLLNPSYYELDSIDNTQVNQFLSSLINKSLIQLEQSSCIEIGEDGDLIATTGGRIASFYYLSHLSLKFFKEALKDELDVEKLIDVVSRVSEFRELPVRHNEDKLNADLATLVPLPVNQYAFDSPHTKCNLLLQAHFSQAPLPVSDYVTDTKSVLDQCLRVMQAMLDYCADQGWLTTSLSIVNLMQMCCQGRWMNSSDLLTLPHVEEEHLIRFYDNKPRVDCLPLLLNLCDTRGDARQAVNQIIGDLVDQNQIRDICNTLDVLPRIDLKLSLSGNIPDKRSFVRKSRNDKDKKKPSDEYDEEGQTQVLKIDNNSDEYYELYGDQEYILNVDLLRMNKKRSTAGLNHKSYAPKYPKPKDENWVVLLGNDTDLVGMKRLNHIKNHQNMHILFRTPEVDDQAVRDGINVLELTLYFMSDVYLGLDQQYELKFKLKPCK